MKVRVMAWFFLAMLIFPLAVASGGQALQWVRGETVTDRALVIAKSKLATPRCKLAFQTRLPEYGKQLDPVAVLEEIKIHKVEWIEGLSRARAAVNCDISPKTMILSTGWAGWAGSEKTAEAIIHELFHLLRCESIVKDCGGWQSNCAPLYIVAEERKAYQVGEICMGN